MKAYEKKRWWKIAIFIAALFIGGFSLWYTQALVKDLAIQEDKKIKLWANATRQLGAATGETDINFLLDIIKDNETIPTILVDEKNQIISHRNLNPKRENDSNYLYQELALMMAEHEPIKIEYDLANNQYNFLYYKNSYL